MGVSDVVAWLTDPANWTGRDAIPLRVGEHIVLSGVSLSIGLAIALPLGLYIGHTGRWAGAVVAITNVGRAIPSVGILGIAYTLTLPLVAALDLRNIGTPAAIIALVALAIPPIVVNAYVGVREVDADTKEAARGLGMTGRQLLRQVEIPLASPVILAGIRTASIQVIAVQPAESLHGLEGLKHMATSIVPPIYQPGGVVDEVLEVSTDEGWDMTDRLVKEEGLFVGHSTGANVCAALRIAERIGEGCIVTIACDRGDRYFRPRVWEKHYEW